MLKQKRKKMDTFNELNALFLKARENKIKEQFVTVDGDSGRFDKEKDLEIQAGKFTIYFVAKVEGFAYEDETGDGSAVYACDDLEKEIEGIEVWNDGEEVEISTEEVEKLTEVLKEFVTVEIC